MPEIGRWSVRDPVAESVGVNLYEFCRNSSIVEYDILGLMLQANCQSIAAYTQAGNNGDPYVKRSVDYLKKNKCAFSIECYECDDCKKQGMTGPGDASHSSVYGPGKGSCTIRFCSSDPSMSGTFILTALRHELAHCCLLYTSPSPRDS